MGGGGGEGGEEAVPRTPALARRASIREDKETDKTVEATDEVTHVTTDEGTTDATDEVTTDEGTTDEGTNVTVLCQRAQELFEEERAFDGAEALYKRVLALEPTHVETLCNYALLLETTQDEDAGEEEVEAELQQADALYRKAAALAPEDSDVLYQRALFLKNVRGDHDEAEALLKQVIALRPTDGTALCNYALLLQHVRGDAAGAQAVYREALSLAPDGLSDEENVALLYSYGTLCEGPLRQVREAEELYLRALAVAPTDSTVQNKLGVLQHTHMNNTAAAQESFERVLSLDPQNVDALSNHALLLQHLKRHAEAYRLLKRAVKIAPSHEHALCNLAQFEHKKRRRLVRARALYRKVIKRHPTHVRALINYGVLEGKHFGNVTKAQRLFQRALDVEPTNPDAQLGFMHCKAMAGDALIQDTQDPAFERLIYNASNMSPPDEDLYPPAASEGEGRETAAE